MSLEQISENKKDAYKRKYHLTKKGLESLMYLIKY